MKKLISLAMALTLCAAAVLTLTACGGTTGPVPIVCGESGMNDACGIATYGVDYYNLGVKAGDMAADILLNGANPATMPVQSDPNPTLIVNEALANEIGFEIPESVKSKAGTKATQNVTRNNAAIVAEGADFEIGILQLIQHDALDASNRGFQDQLSVRMAAANKTVTILDQNASGDESNNTTIVSTFVDRQVDLIYTIATSSSQAAASATNTIPVIFNAVTNPVDAGLVTSMEAPGKNVTGVSDINPVADQIALIGELLGEENVKIGLLYTSSETNSIFQIELAKKACEAKGYTFVERGISDINDLEAAMIYLKKEGITAIYVPTDNTLANGTANLHVLNTAE